MCLNIRIAFYATMTHRVALRTLNKYVKKVMYTNIRLAFCASMPHGWTKQPRREAEIPSRISNYMTIKFDTLILI